MYLLKNQQQLISRILPQMCKTADKEERIFMFQTKTPRAIFMHVTVSFFFFFFFFVTISMSIH